MLIEELVAVLRAGSGEDVARTPLLDLRHQRVGPGEGELDRDTGMGPAELGCDLGEHPVERGRSQHGQGDRTILRTGRSIAARGCARCQQQGDESRPRAGTHGPYPHRPGPSSLLTMTDVALIVATTGTPGARASSSTASLVMAAARR